MTAAVHLFISGRVLVDAARHTGVFLCEATYLDASPAELDHHGHLTPELAADVAERADVRHLVLTHLARVTDAAAAAAAASRRFGTARSPSRPPAPRSPRRR